MPRDDMQFLAYRGLSEQFEIWFYGGPLDGAKIQTDVFPDSSSFVHRVRDRVYVYRYHPAGDKIFHACFVHTTPSDPPVKDQRGVAPVLAWVVVLAMAVLALLLTALAN